MRFFILVFLTLFLVTCSSSTDEVLDIRLGVSNPRFGDNDPHDWVNDSKGRKPWEYPVHGIDVAKYQGNIDWSAVKRAGVAFVFLKATEGGDRVDDRFAEYWQQTRRAGIPRSAYHFFYFCRPAFEQARWYISHVPKERGSLPPVLDMEWNHASPSCKFRPDAASVRREMGVFLSMLKRHYGKAPIIYTTIDFYRDNELWNIKGHDFWLRSVAAHPSAIYPDQPWRFWQYTGTGQMPGIEGDTDINVFYGSPSQWRDWVKENAIQ